MAEAQMKPINIVYCYNHDSRIDTAIKDDLIKHISKITGVVTQDYNDVPLGRPRKETINNFLASADILLLLESIDFHVSDECLNLEKIAKEMYAKQEVHVVPILLREIEFEGRRFSELQGLPRDNGEYKYITAYSDRDKACQAVRNEIKNIVNTIHINRTRKEYIKNGKIYFNKKNYDNALKVYINAIQHFSQDDTFFDYTSIQKQKADIWCEIASIHLIKAEQHFACEGYDDVLKECSEALKYPIVEEVPADNTSIQKKKADIWRWVVTINYKRENWQQALLACQKVVGYDPSDVKTHITMAEIHMQLSETTDAIDVYTNAIFANSQSAELYTRKIALLSQAGQLEKALATCNKAISACANKIVLIRQKGTLLYRSGRYIEACEVYEDALTHDPDNIYLYSEYGDALLANKRFEEAFEAYEKAIKTFDNRARAYDDKAINNQTYIEMLEKKDRDAYEGMIQKRKAVRAAKEYAER